MGISISLEASSSMPRFVPRDFSSRGRPTVTRRTTLEFCNAATSCILDCLLFKVSRPRCAAVKERDRSRGRARMYMGIPENKLERGFMHSVMREREEIFPETNAIYMYDDNIDQEIYLSIK